MKHIHSAVNIYWLSIVIASFFEVLWVIGLKHASSLFEWLGTVCSIFFTFVLINFANKKIPVGTTYTVFVGLGTVGAFLSDILLFNATVKGVTLIFLFLLLIGIIGLKTVSQKEEKLSTGMKK